MWRTVPTSFIRSEKKGGPFKLPRGTPAFFVSGTEASPERPTTTWAWSERKEWTYSVA